MPGDPTDTVMAESSHDSSDIYRAPMVSKVASGTSSEGSVKPIPELSPFLTPEQQTRIAADLEPFRNKSFYSLLATAGTSLLAIDAPSIARIVLAVTAKADDDEEFKAGVEEIMVQGKDLLTIFTLPAIFERLKATRPDTQVEAYTLGGNQMNATIKAWDLPYVGRAVSLLHDAINQMNVTRQSRPDKDNEYANFVPIVQSSGTGKSRLVNELARCVFTLPFNIRPGGELAGYPMADPGVLNFLNPPDETTTQLRLRHTIFLGKLFEEVRKVLVSMEKEESPKALATAFYNWLKDERQNLYQDVISKADVEYTEIKKQVQTIKLSGPTPKAVISKLVDLVDQTTVPALEQGRLLIDDIKAMSGALSDSESQSKPVWLVIYFDESHPLTSADMPECDDGKQFTPYQILCSTLNNFRKLDLFAIFLSTNSSLFVYSPPQVAHWSTRVRQAITPGVQAPFIELPFDVYDGTPLLFENKHKLQDVCKPEFMVRFGRPLFCTRYQCGDDGVKGDIIQFARLKLAPTREKEAKIAILSVRLGLSFERSRQQARDIGNQLVQGYMHLAFGATTHREYMYVGPSSEPILAEAAAQLMYEPDVIGEIVEILNRWCGDGLITKGERGELVVRVILTKAHDWVIRLKSPSGPFSQPIRLSDYLVALVGETHAQKILDATPDNVPDDTTLAKSALGDALLHFTHWAKAKNESIVKDEAAWIALCRGMAWQCHDQQEDIDHITPLLLWNEKLGRYTVSAIFWQTKNRSRPQKVHIDAEKMGFFTPHPEPQHRANRRPYLTIVLNLSAKTKPRSSQEVAETQSTMVVSPRKRISPRNVEKLPLHPRYAVTISGCSHTIYPNVIARGQKDQYASLLSSRGWFEEHPRRDRRYLEAITQIKPTWTAGEGAMGTFTGVEFDGPSCLVKPSPKPTQAEPVTVGAYLDGTEDEAVSGVESEEGASDEEEFEVDETQEDHMSDEASSRMEGLRD